MKRPKMRRKLYENTPRPEHPLALTYSSMKTFRSVTDGIRIKTKSHLLLRETQVRSGVFLDVLA